MAIEVKNLNVYIKENHILKDVNILFPEKQITCIIGPSGCGKSTLLRTLNRLIDSTEHVRLEGQVLVDGVDVIGSGPEITELRRKIGLVSQRPCPLPMSIFDNVAYGCRINRMYRKHRQLIWNVQKQLQAVGLCAPRLRAFRSGSSSGSVWRVPWRWSRSTSLRMRPPVPWIPFPASGWRICLSP